jgi:N4-gp56 family major capsid protein
MSEGKSPYQDKEMNKFFSLVFSVLGFGADVITVSTGSAGNAGSSAAELTTYISAKALLVAERKLILEQFGDKQALPQGAGKTVRFNRYEKFAVAATPTQLTEGAQPDAVGVTINQFEATVEQYGMLVRLADLAEITAKHPLVQQSVQRVGTHAAEVRDQLVFNVLDAATSVYRPNSKANDTSLVGSDYVTYNDLVALYAKLAEQGGSTFDNGLYAIVLGPQVHAAMLKDPDYKAANQLSNADRIFRGTIDMLAGFNVVMSNAAVGNATAQAGSGQASKVYSGFAMARESFQVTDLQSLEVIITPAGGHGDALKQSTKIGYKFSFKANITNQNWIWRVRSAGLDSVTNP